MIKMRALSANRMPRRFGKKTLVVAATLIVLSGCASIDFEKTLATTNRDAAGFTDGNLALVQTKEQRADRDRVASEILAKPLGQSEAVRLALVHSPALHARVAQSWADGSKAAQAGRIANPSVSFECVRLSDA